MSNIIRIAGVDEVGRGCLAGPVFAAAVILKKNINTKHIKDSKKLSFNKRILLSQYIKKNSIYAVGIATVEEIDEINIWVIASFHPAFLMRQPEQKKMAWIDLKMIREKFKILKI